MQDLLISAPVLSICPISYWILYSRLDAGRPSLILMVVMFFAPWWFPIWFFGTYRPHKRRMAAIRAEQYRLQNWSAVESSRY